MGTFSNVGFEDYSTVKYEDLQVALGDIDTNMKVHIQRPEVVLTSL